MFPELNRLLDGETTQSVVISSSNTDGDFLVHHFIGTSVQKPYSRIFVVAFAQTIVHYRAVAQKLGIGFKSACESSRIVFMDCLSRSDSENQRKKVRHFKLDSEEVLFDLYGFIKTNLEQSESESSCPAIIIDDLTPLICLGFNPRKILLFSQMCLSLCAESKPRGLFVAYVRNDADVEDEEARLVQTQLQYWCQLHVQVSGLRSGRSKAVHGDMTIRKCNPAQGSPTDVGQSVCVQYRVRDKGLAVFAKGTSSAVL
eukprot:m.8694 g.8694  ORF g.8694 m.8694 type:complete len:257 (+) comp20768_c0_seq1:89-859(+)